MARQISAAKRERRVGILTFYKMGGKYYVRMRSRLSGERVKTSPEFKNTMIYANRMGLASRLASVIYRQLPPAWKLHELYRKLTGHAMHHLKEGMDPNHILGKLEAVLRELGYSKNIQYPTIHSSTTKLKKPKPHKDLLPKEEVWKKKENQLITNPIYLFPCINQEVSSLPYIAHNFSDG